MLSRETIERASPLLRTIAGCPNCGAAMHQTADGPFAGRWLCTNCGHDWAAAALLSGMDTDNPLYWLTDEGIEQTMETLVADLADESDE